MTDELVAAAVADLVGRLNVEAAAITVVSDEAVVWPDGSAGCPQPGMMYPQMLTEGSRIVLEHAGRRYDYHSARNRPPFLCEQPGSPFSRKHPLR
ncbi:hypothetical protein [Nakamurella lactea]|uniref:hypothetical protein n=1 Tax=Nakamurella lactea TaxID=459515 RepID=UPI000400FB00|nr:hypothetical protein [Nakamurella lactea]